MWSAARSAKISMILCMPERVSGGDAKFQGFCDRWNKWEGQPLPHTVWPSYVYGDRAGKRGCAAMLTFNGMFQLIYIRFGIALPKVFQLAIYLLQWRSPLVPSIYSIVPSQRRLGSPARTSF